MDPGTKAPFATPTLFSRYGYGLLVVIAVSTSLYTPAPKPGAIGSHGSSAPGTPARSPGCTQGRHQNPARCRLVPGVLHMVPGFRAGGSDGAGVDHGAGLAFPFTSSPSFFLPFPSLPLPSPLCAARKFFSAPGPEIMVPGYLSDGAGVYRAGIWCRGNFVPGFGAGMHGAGVCPAPNVSICGNPHTAKANPGGRPGFRAGVEHRLCRANRRRGRRMMLSHSPCRPLWMPRKSRRIDRGSFGARRRLSGTTGGKFIKISPSTFRMHLE